MLTRIMSFYWSCDQHSLIYKQLHMIFISDITKEKAGLWSEKRRCCAQQLRAEKDQRGGGGGDGLVGGVQNICWHLRGWLSADSLSNTPLFWDFIYDNSLLWLGPIWGLWHKLHAKFSTQERVDQFTEARKRFRILLETQSIARSSRPSSAMSRFAPTKPQLKFS